ncbi:MAG TPA: ribosome silencing factor [Terriglobales bacterium]|nr:ribosome silencing factor [Terriglobales bacterium]
MMELNAKALALDIARILDSKKAEDIRVLHIGDLTILADYFVIATGTSSTQVKALAEEVEFQLSEKGVEPHHAEGRRTDRWILLDYGSVVVHVFYKESREFYNLERLWADAEQIDGKEWETT